LDQNIKMLLLGSAGTLVAVGAVAGLWSMQVAPPPPAVAAAQQQEKLVTAEIRVRMGEFLNHHSRAEAAALDSAWDRAKAHLLVMKEISEELRAEHLRAKLPSENISMLQQSLDQATTLVDAKDEKAAPAVTSIKQACTKCHVMNKGPRFGEVITDEAAAAPTSGAAPAKAP
jgi:hypothetical protein